MTDPTVSLAGRLQSYGMPYDDMFEFHPRDTDHPYYLSLPPDLISYHSKSALHWAALLDRTVVLTLKADPQDPTRPATPRTDQAVLVDFHIDENTSIAEQFPLLRDPVAVLPSLRGLIAARFASTVPAGYYDNSHNAVDMREIIIWKDDSVTVIESRRSPFNGAMGNDHILPPLRDIGELITLPDFDAADSLHASLVREAILNDVVDFASIAKSTSAIAQRIPPRGNSPDYPPYSSIIEPAASAAYRFHRKLLDHLAQHNPPAE